MPSVAESAKPIISKSAVVNASSAHNGLIKIQCGDEIFRARFSKQGNDLIITLPDDNEVMLIRYFSQAKPPSLLSESGKYVSSDAILTLTYSSRPFLSDDFINNRKLPVIGEIKNTTAKIMINRFNGSEKPSDGVCNIQVCDIISLESDGSVEIELNDGTVIVLDSKAKLMISDFIPPIKDAEGYASFSLLSGKMAFASGKVATGKNDRFFFHTNSAKISVRGTTSGVVEYLEDGSNKISIEYNEDGKCGWMDIATAGGKRSLYHPNAIIMVENSLQIPQQKANTFSLFDDLSGDSELEEGDDLSIADGKSEAEIIELENKVASLAEEIPEDETQEELVLLEDEEVESISEDKDDKEDIVIEEQGVESVDESEAIKQVASAMEDDDTQLQILEKEHEFESNNEVSEVMDFALEENSEVQISNAENKFEEDNHANNQKSVTQIKENEVMSNTVPLRSEYQNSGKEFKVIDFVGLEYSSLSFRKEGDEQNDMVIGIKNSNGMNHRIVIKGFFSENSTPHELVFSQE